MIHTKTLAPGRSVLFTMHEHRSFGPTGGHTVLVLFTPVLNRRVLCFGGKAEVFQRYNLVSPHSNYNTGDEAHDSNDWIAGWVIQEGFLEGSLLVDFLLIVIGFKRRRVLDGLHESWGQRRIHSWITQKRSRRTGRGALGTAGAEEAKRRVAAGLVRRMAVRRAFMVMIVVGKFLLEEGYAKWNAFCFGWRL